MVKYFISVVLSEESSEFNDFPLFIILKHSVLHRKSKDTSINSSPTLVQVCLFTHCKIVLYYYIIVRSFLLFNDYFYLEINSTIQFISCSSFIIPLIPPIRFLWPYME